MKAPKTVMLFSNGNTSAFDDSGQQIGDLQKGWLHIWLEWMESQGVDPTEIKNIETIVNGRNVYLRPFKTDDGSWNCSISDF
jgi:hypothetical protein